MGFNLEAGITLFFCAIAGLMVWRKAVASNGHYQSEGLIFSAFACAALFVAWQDFYPKQTESIVIGALAISILGAWVAWKDSADHRTR